MDLVDQLEEKVKKAIEEIQSLRRQISDLEEENKMLAENDQERDEKLKNLLQKFEETEQTSNPNGEVSVPPPHDENSSHEQHETYYHS